MKGIITHAEKKTTKIESFINWLKYKIKFDVRNNRITFVIFILIIVTILAILFLPNIIILCINYLITNKWDPDLIAKLGDSFNISNTLINSIILYTVFKSLKLGQDSQKALEHSLEMQREDLKINQKTYKNQLEEMAGQREEMVREREIHEKNLEDLRVNTESQLIERINLKMGDLTNAVSKTNILDYSLREFSKRYEKDPFMNSSENMMIWCLNYVSTFERCIGHLEQKATKNLLLLFISIFTLIENLKNIDAKKTIYGNLSIYINCNHILCIIFCLCKEIGEMSYNQEMSEFFLVILKKDLKKLELERKVISPESDYDDIKLLSAMIKFIENYGIPNKPE